MNEIKNKNNIQIKSKAEKTINQSRKKQHINYSLLTVVLII